MLLLRIVSSTARYGIPPLLSQTLLIPIFDAVMWRIEGGGFTAHLAALNHLLYIIRGRQRRWNSLINIIVAIRISRKSSYGGLICIMYFVLACAVELNKTNLSSIIEKFMRPRSTVTTSAPPSPVPPPTVLNPSPFESLNEGDNHHRDEEMLRKVTIFEKGILDEFVVDRL